MVPLLDGMLGAVVPARIWFGAIMSIVGVGMLECSGSPPNVSVIILISIPFPPCSFLFIVSFDL